MTTIRAREAAETVQARRLAQLAEALGRTMPAGGAGAQMNLASALQALVDPRNHSEVWLALAVLTGLLPTDHEVIEIARESEFDGGEAMAKHVAASPAEHATRTVVIPMPGTVILDVTTTLEVPYMTGIQRVVRETSPRWLARGAVPVVWLPSRRGIRPLTDLEDAALAARQPVDTKSADSDHSVVIVPWRCTYVTAEYFNEIPRADRIRSLARFSGGRSSAVVHDCSPVTLGETRQDWHQDPFVFYLSALAQFDQLAADSAATEAEFRGWRHALSATGIAGPAIEEVMLAAEITQAKDEDVAATRALLLSDRAPLVGVVGSREPRKNHLAVLHAAELVWRRGIDFTLAFLGGRSWHAGAFAEEVARLRSDGRKIDIVGDLSDEQMAAAYQIATFTLFPSISEGFGLPVAESLMLGTPVITTNYGSTAEIARDGGALLVDPRDDHAIADAMERLLTDADLLAELRSQARARAPRTWDHYCDQAWDLLVSPSAPEDGKSPTAEHLAGLSDEG